MSLHDQWGSEKASDWTVTLSKVTLQPIKKNTIKKADNPENEVSILKTDEDKRLVFGWASISITVDGEQLEDSQQDMIDPEDLEEAAYEYVLNFRDTGEEHIPSMRKKGKLVESCVFTEEKQQALGIPPGTLPIGWWVGFKITDDDAWARVKDGTYKMFSIEGRAVREPVAKSDPNYDEHPGFWEWLEEHNEATLEEQKAAREHYKKKKKEEKVGMAKSFNDIMGFSEPRTISKSDPNRFDVIEEVFGKSDRFDHIEEVQKFNPWHDSKGRFSSGPGGGGSFSANPNTKAGKLAIERAGKDNPLVGAAFNREYGSTNTGDALDEIKSGKTNSLAAHMDENGKLTPEREAVHKQIIDDLLEGKVPVAGQATMTMLGGGPASGKSSVMNPDTSKDKNAVTVDPDAIKAMLPGYAEMAKQSSNAASFYHEESSALAKRFSEVAYKENYNVIYDGTADGSVGSVMKKVNGAKAQGYRVEMKYVSIDTEEAVRRNQKRYDDAVAAGQTPRLPPVSMVIATHTKCTDISVAVAKDVDHIEIWDNNGARGQQKLVATGGNGKGLVATDKAGFDRYLSKGAKGLDGFMTLPDGQVVPVE